jgi:two-component system cell cycle response regulator
VDLLIATDGKQGLQMAVTVQPDLILLDVEMPDPDGFTVCRDLKSRPETMQIPIVFLTGVSSSEEKIKGLELGAIDYITKPFDPAELRARVRASLRTKYLLDLLAKKAQIDGLTGLWNRGQFDHRLASELSLAKRTNDPLSVMMVDIDNFKSINDTFGHPTGDEIIRQVGQIITDCVRLEDVVCRYGGEEFAIVMPNTSSERASIAAERIRRKLNDGDLNALGENIKVTASFGVAGSRGASDRTVRAADEALYRAKRCGRNRIERAADVAPEAPNKPQAA